MTSTVDAAPAPAPAGRSRRLLGLRPWVQWTLLAAPVVILGVQAWGHRWMEDDGFINLHVVQQIMAGNGPVFNGGQRVEAFTSPIWLFMLVVGHVILPIQMEWTAVALGIACSVAGLALAIAGAAILVRDRRPGELLVPAGVLVLLALMPVWYFATSGLEMGLVFLWEGASLWILARWARDGGTIPWWGAVVLGLSWLIRPELVLFTLVFAAVVLGAGWRRESWKDRVRFVVALAALPLAYEIFRMGYYASLVPNVALAKEAGRARWGAGWQYFRSSLSPYWLWIPAVILAGAAYAPAVRSLRRHAERRALLVVGAFVLGGVLAALYIVRVGGDYLHARLLLPSIFALCAPVAVVPLRRWTLGALLVVPWALWCGLALRPPGVTFGVFGSNAQHAVTVNEFGWQPGSPYRSWFTGEGFYYNGRRLPYPLARGVPDPEVASFGIGIASYAFGPNVDTIDMLGLADPFTSHLQLQPIVSRCPVTDPTCRPAGFANLSRGPIPGHEKPIPIPWLVARFIRPGTNVDPVDFPPGKYIGSTLQPTTGPAFDEEVAWARAALGCKNISSLLQASSRPLTPGTFLGNIGRSFSQTSLRIPPDPRVAYREYCGSGQPPGTSSSP